MCEIHALEHLVCENLLNLHPLSLVCAFSLYEDILRAFRVCLTLVLNLRNCVRNKRIARKQSEYGTREYHIEKLTFEWKSTIPYLGKNISQS
jgi:hypothetical protein